MSDGIFDFFISHDVRQDRAMDRIDASLDMVLDNQASTAQNLSSQLRELYALDREQGRELRHLRATVRVLGELLVENGVDPSVLQIRVQAAIGETEIKAAERAKAEKMIACASCGKKVPLQRTNITASGTVCDRCAL